MDNFFPQHYEMYIKKRGGAKRKAELDDKWYDDPKYATEYVTDIFEYLKELEVKMLPNSTKIEENGLDFLQYKILVDYMIQTYQKLKIEFRMWDDTLFTAMSIVNRYLSLTKAPSSPEKLQLLVLASILISIKYNQGNTISIEDFMEVTGSNFHLEELKIAERYVLKIIDYVVDAANPYEFLRRCNSAEGYNYTTRDLAKYLLELTIDSNFVDFKPSVLAAASIFLSRKIQGKNEWGENEIKFCGYTKDELSQTVKQIEKRLSEPGIENEFVFNKYKKQAQYVAERM